MAFIVQRKGRVISRNAHLPERASRTIDAVVPIIQQQNHHAIQAKGFPVYIYQRLTAGKKCKCSMCEHANPFQSAFYDDTGVASPQQLQSIMDRARFSIDDYNAESGLEKTVRDINREAESETGGLETEFDIPIPLESDAFSAGACPICLGTGIKGGYSCLEATRIVLCAEDGTSKGATVETKGYPNVITLHMDDSYVDFEVTLPMPLPNSMGKVRVFNGFEVLHGTLLIEDNGTWRPFQGTTKAGKNRFRVSKSNFMPTETHVFEFTHLEIMLPLVTQPDYLDIPNLVNNFDSTKVYPYAPTTFSLSPNMPTLNARDVIADLQHKLLWLVTSAAPTYAANGQIWHQNVEVRCIEPYEATHSLLIPNYNWISTNNGHVLKNSEAPTIRRGGY